MSDRARGGVRVLHVTFHPPSHGRTPHRLLEEIPHYTGLLAALRATGTDVEHIQTADRDVSIERPEAVYHFVRENGPGRFGRPPAPHRLARRVRELEPDVLHVHGLALPGHLRVMRDVNPAVPVLVQDHANRLPRWWERRRFARVFSQVEGFAFTSPSHAAEFAGLPGWPSDTPCFTVMESSTGFSPGDRAVARDVTGVTGEPAVVWVGRLDRNKDPLTVLDGLSRVAPEYPKLEIWCCYGEDELLTRAQRFVAARPALAGRVHWLGSVPHPRVQDLLRAADVYVSGSHREGSGYALLEALATGTPPLVTDIPSFRVMTNDGAIGALFARGAPASFATAFRRLVGGGTAAHRPAVARHFQDHLSYPAVAAALARAYQAVRSRP